MITHEAPGSTFWDRIRAGAEQAAKQHGITSSTPTTPTGQAGHAHPERHRQQGRRHRGHAGQPRRSRSRAAEGRRRRHPDRGLQLRPRQVPEVRRDDVTSARTRAWPGRAPASGSPRSSGAGRQGPLRGARAGQRSLETRCAGVKQAFPNTENLQVNGRTCRRSSRPSRPSWPRTRRSPTSSPSTQASPAPPSRPRPPPAARRRSSPSTSARTSSRRSRTRRSSSPSTSSPTCRPTWPSTRCGCT